MKITPFAVEQWMNEYETRCEFNLAETCVESLTVSQLLSIAGKEAASLAELLPMKLTYGAIEGSDRLRRAIAALYASARPADVLVAHGAIGANALVYQGLIGPGDHVVSIVPNYQQHYSIPESLGARVSRLQLRESARFLPDLDELRRLVAGGAKLISLSNPNNPTGSLMDRRMLEEIAAIAETVGAYVLADEVYRGATQESDELTPSICDVYPRGISTGSMSKAFSLAGLRLGWIVGPHEVLKAAEIHRDYSTISVGMLDDHFASIALENAGRLLARTRARVRGNLAVLDRWMAGEESMSYTKPEAGTTALLKVRSTLSSREFCVRLLETQGVLFTPGSALDMEGYVRIGYANTPSVVTAGLPRVSAFVRSLDA
jgi:aspartate/methionine/tyrosine aminotransferase